jgi:hypothetical protein
MKGNDLDRFDAAAERSVVAQAARIGLDATEVDWSRDPVTEYEAEIRQTWLVQQMERGPFGRMEIAELSFGLDDIGTDLEEALDALVMLEEVRAARRQRRSLRAARDEVNHRQFRC